MPTEIQTYNLKSYKPIFMSGVQLNLFLHYNVLINDRDQIEPL